MDVMVKRTMNIDPFEIVQTVHEPLVALGEGFNVLFANAAFDRKFNTTREMTENRSIFEINDGMFDTAEFRDKLEDVLSKGTILEDYEIEHTFRDIGYRIFVISAKIVKPRGEVKTRERQILVGINDITEMRLAADELKAKAKDLLDLSTPVTQIWDGLLVLPIIGTMDSARTAMMMEQVLVKIRDTSAKYVIMDTTGVAVIDTAVAANLFKAASAVKLLGAEMILTGLRPEVAMTMVHLGVDMGSVTTRATLKDGIAYAFARMGLAIGGKQEKNQKERKETHG
ncbi:MAG: STAS domain-containing protein [Methanomicrobiales archaeon]